LSIKPEKHFEAS